MGQKRAAWPGTPQVPDSAQELGEAARGCSNGRLPRAEQQACTGWESLRVQSLGAGGHPSSSPRRGRGKPGAGPPLPTGFPKASSGASLHLNKISK